jgi:hypothetical protein
MTQLASGFSSRKASSDVGSHPLSGEDAGRCQAYLTTATGKMCATAASFETGSSTPIVFMGLLYCAVSSVNEREI